MTTYARLVEAMKSGDESLIASLCKPDAIRLISTPRAERAKEAGSAKEINLPFAKEGLDVQLILVRKDSDQRYLLRTTTTAFWFTKTADGQWQLTDYLDKPIE